MKITIEHEDADPPQLDELEKKPLVIENVRHVGLVGFANDVDLGLRRVLIRLGNDVVLAEFMQAAGRQLEDELKMSAILQKLQAATGANIMTPQGVSLGRNGRPLKFRPPG